MNFFQIVDLKLQLSEIVFGELSCSSSESSIFLAEFTLICDKSVADRHYQVHKI